MREKEQQGGGKEHQGREKEQEGREEQGFQGREDNGGQLELGLEEERQFPT